MKTIGIVGGLGPESTVDYYQRIIRAFVRRRPAATYPEIVIFSANSDELFARVDRRDWDGIAAMLAEKVRALAAAGAEFAAISANTPHIVFDRVAAASPIPLLSIVEATRDAARDAGMKRVGLLGTKLTMSSNFYADAFRPAGIEVVAPTEEEQQLIHHRLMTEIELGVLKPETRAELNGIGRRLQRDHAIDGLVLGCTELPLIMTAPIEGLPLLDTTAIHCERIVRECESR
ncbi:MAG TPA: amino acid racemase [Anaeromyxobacteraceae bacterium]|nr:amino acid racemase [Anaeromyxobacteraceae bacterium]